MYTAKYIWIHVRIFLYENIQLNMYVCTFVQKCIRIIKMHSSIPVYMCM